MRIIIHRGSKQIGGTCVELISETSRILLDLGMPLYDRSGGDIPDGVLDGRDLANPEDINELKKIGILPDVKGLYQDDKPGFDAILISHSHGDHYGLVHFAHPDIPLMISEGARRMIETLNSFLPKQVNLSHTIPADSRTSIEIGAFTVTPYFMDHSAFDARGFFIRECRTGRVLFYSGDFRAGGSKCATFEQLVKNPPIKNIDYLLMEGTTIGRPEAEYKTEVEAEGAFGEILKQGHNLILLACSGQNIDRIKSTYLKAQEYGYSLIIDPYVACVLDNIKGMYGSFVPQLDMPGMKALLCNFVRTMPPSYSYVNKISQDPTQRFIKLLSPLGRKKISPRDIAKATESIIIVRDGIVPSLKKIPNVDKAFVVYSQWKGYLKKNGKLTTFLKGKGLTNEGVNLKYIHTSGHADIPTLKRLVAALNPSKIIPVHTEKPGEYSALFGQDKLLIVPDAVEVEL